MKREWLVPLTGVGFVALLIIGFAVGGEPPDADSPAQEIADHYVDSKDEVVAGSLLVGIAAVLLVFFAGYLRKVLSAAEGPGGMLPALSLVGAAIIATGGAIDATISLSLAEAAEDVEPAAVQALQALWDNDFLPIALGIIVFLLSTGIAIVRSRALPRWLGWFAIALAVLALTPVGFAAFFGMGIWILIASVLLSLRARRPGGAEPVAPGPA